MIIGIDLSKIDFDNDSFSTYISNREMIIFNRINEDCSTKYGRLRLDMVVLTHIKDGARSRISNVIGVKNGKFRITSTEKSISGLHLTYDLMKMCVLEIEND